MLESCKQIQNLNLLDVYRKAIFRPFHKIYKDFIEINELKTQIDIHTNSNIAIQYITIFT